MLATAMIQVGQRFEKISSETWRTAGPSTQPEIEKCHTSHATAKNAAADTATAMSSVRPARTPCGASWNGPEAASDSMPVIITEPAAIAPANAIMTVQAESCSTGAAVGNSLPLTEPETNNPTITSRNAAETTTRSRARVRTPRSDRSVMTSTTNRPTAVSCRWEIGSMYPANWASAATETATVKR
ncbi:MAG: hypothetical protein NVV57_11460 [Demequina sp.]|nr:hypothetical protein [Demequina sp.]